MKVCHMTSAHDPEDIRIFHKECVSLAKNGYDVYLVERGDSYEKNGVHIVGVGTIPDSRLQRMTQGARRVYEAALALDCDIYHFHDPELLPYGVMLKKKGKKVIFDSHERYTYQLRDKPYLPHWMSGAVAALYGRYEEYVLGKLDAVIFPCTMDGKNPFEGLCRRTPIISNAAILDEFYNLYDPAAEKNPRQICYVGALTESRGITADVLAASRAGAVLALAGEYSSEEYQSVLSQMPEYACVDYRGILNRSQVTDLIAQSCVGLCTFLDRGQYLHLDTFGIKVFEYLSMGVPVILSKSDFNCRMVEKYQFGVCVDPEDTDEIAEAIRYLIDHPDDARRMGENGRKAIRGGFNWGVEEKKLLGLYEDIMGA